MDHIKDYSLIMNITKLKKFSALFQPHLPLTSSTSASSAGGLTTPTSPRPSATDMSGLPGTAGAIVVGYRGTFAFGRDGMADVCFRKLTRILVHGKVNFLLCIPYSTFNYRTNSFWDSLPLEHKLLLLQCKIFCWPWTRFCKFLKCIR